MTVITILPLKWSSLAIIVTLGFVVDKCTVFGLEGDEQLMGTNRVLPVDADHKNKISIPQPNTVCLKNLKESLVKFLKRVKKDGVRKGRQDDGDDGDGDDEGLAGVIAGIQNGDGALSALQALPSLVPQLVQGLTQFTSQVNQGLNGTDTPNLPSFLVRQGQQFFQAIAGASAGGGGSRHPSQVQVHPIPNRPSGGGGGVSRPQTPSYEQYPGTDIDDYPDEEVKQPLQPTLRPLRPNYGGNDLGLGLRPNYEPIPGGNPFKNPSGPQSPESGEGVQMGTSLWQIYKSYRNKAPGNGTLTEFQLAHPDAFSNELLQSISQSISSIRGQTQNQAVPTDKPSSEIFKQFYPENQNPPVINVANRPTLSVYKPAASSGGIGIDLSNLAINASISKLTEQSPSLSSSNVNKEEDETTPAASLQEELEASSILGLGDKESLANQKPGVNSGTTHNTGTFAQLQLQQAQAMKESAGNGPQFVKSPTSSLLTLQMGEYIPALTSLHEGDTYLAQVGPQTNSEDHFNGFRNKAPYEAVKDVLIVAPRLTPSPLFPTKPPSNLYLNEAIETTTPTPEYSYQFQASNSKLSSSGVSSLYPPNAAHVRPVDPNAPRPPTISAAITSQYPSDPKPNDPSSVKAPTSISDIASQYQLPKNPFQSGGILPPSLLPTLNPVPESEPLKETVSSSTARSSSPESAEIETLEKETTSVPAPSPAEDIAPPVSSEVASSSSNSKTSVLASSLSNLAQFTPVQQNPSSRTTTENYEADVTSNNPFSTVLMNTMSQLNLPVNQQNSKLFQHLLGNLNLPELLKHPQILQSLLASQALKGNSGLSASPPAQLSLIVTPEPEISIQQEIQSSTFSSFIPEETTISLQNASPFQQNINQNIQNPALSFPSVPFKPIGTKPVPSFGVSSQSSGGFNPFANILQNVGIDVSAIGTNNPVLTGDRLKIPSFGSQLQSQQQNTPPFQIQPVNELPASTDPPFTGNQFGGGFGNNLINSGLNFVPPQGFPPAQGIDFFNQASSTEAVTLPPPPSAPLNAWGTQIDLNDPYDTAAFIDNSNINSNAASFVGGSFTGGQNSQSSQLPPLDQLPPFSGPGGFAPAPEINKNNVKVEPEATTTEIMTTEKEINLAELTFNYQNLNGFPQSIPIASPVQTGNLSPSPPVLPSVPNQGKPSHWFQGPTLLPIIASNFESAESEEPLPAYGGSISSSAQTQTSPTISNETGNNSPPSTPIPSNSNSGGSSFSQTLQHLGPSAINEMSMLPFIQEDTFRPSALPPYLVHNNADKEDSYEQVEPENAKPISDIFSTVVNSSVTEGTLAAEDIPTTTVKQDRPTTIEEDSFEQPYPEFPPGKPAFWMNMYYPNGIPVLMKVTTTTSTTTMKPRKRRRSTTTTLATTSIPESDYYDDDDPTTDTKLKKKKKKVQPKVVS